MLTDALRCVGKRGSRHPRRACVETYRHGRVSLCGDVQLALHPSQQVVEEHWRAPPGLCLPVEDKAKGRVFQDAPRWKCCQGELLFGLGEEGKKMDYQSFTCWNTTSATFDFYQ